MAQGAGYRLVVDARERELVSLFAGAVETRTLDVGDVLCEYADGTSWVVERKTAADLANSIRTGRWLEQKDRLVSSGHKVFYVFEGDFRSRAELPYAALVGAFVNTTLRDGVQVLRTVDIVETKYLLVQLAKKSQSVATLPHRGLASKRKKDCDVDVIWVRQLATIPTISEHIATALLKQFVTMGNLREALRDPKNFPVVHLSRGTTLGRARIDKLAAVLLA